MSKRYPSPDFFIVGAPRCGTTALSTYLSEHSRICFSDPKEPLFFCDDLPGLRFVNNESDYLARCFTHGVDGEFAAVGEGSVWYLYSHTAIRNILGFCPEARFIFMLRNPLEMLASLHQKLFYFLDEDQADFEDAWRLQERRRQGLDVADTCREPRILQYAEIGKLGEQLQRAFDLVPEAQRMTIRFDDFRQDTQAVYQRTLEFLGVEDDGRSEFPRVNENQRVRNRYLLEKAWNPPHWILRVVSVLKKPFGIQRINLLARLRGSLIVPDDRGEMSAALQQEILDVLGEDILLLENITGYDLSDWQAKKSSTQKKQSDRITRDEC